MRILHWHYNDGVQQHYDLRLGDWVVEPEIEQSEIGWHCWVFMSSDETQFFNDWLQLHIRKGYEAISRFNSGDPMTTLQIVDETESLKFKEYWSEYFDPY